MKIAFIVSVFPSSLQTFILNQVTGLLDQGFDIKIFAASKLKDDEERLQVLVKEYCLEERVCYFHIPKNKIKRILQAVNLIVQNFGKGPGKLLKTLNVFKDTKLTLTLKLVYMLVPFLNEEFDIIHCHFYHNGIIGAKLKELGIKGKIITSFHGANDIAIMSNKNEEIRRNLFHLGDLFLPMSDNWKKRLIQLNCDAGKIVVHRYGTDLANLQYLERKIQEGEPIRILTVGRLVEMKGHEYTIRSIAKVAEDHKNIEYIIVGGGPLRKKLESLVSELGITDYVKFLGSLEHEDVLDYYRRAHIFVLSSITTDNGAQEGVPNVLIEAQASGLPVIATSYSGIPELVVDGKSGFLVPERDVDALAAKLEYLIKHHEIWPEMGRCGRRVVEEKYDITRQNERLAEVYHNIILNR